MKTKRVIIKTVEAARAFLEVTGREDLASTLDDHGRVAVPWYCRRCGGTGHHSYCPDYGTMCFQCEGKPERMEGVTWTSIIDHARSLRQKDRAAERRKEKAEAELKRKDDAFEASIEDHGLEGLTAEWIDKQGEIKPLPRQIHILRNLRSKLWQFGSLSEKQIAFAKKLTGEVENRAAEQELKVDAPIGRQEISGVVLACRESDGEWGGYRFTMKIEEDDGRHWIGNGTVPRAISREWKDPSDLKGRRISLTATVEPSNNDATFAFLKRPTKAIYLDQAEMEEAK